MGLRPLPFEIQIHDSKSTFEMTAAIHQVTYGRQTGCHSLISMAEGYQVKEGAVIEEGNAMEERIAMVDGNVIEERHVMKGQC